MSDFDPSIFLSTLFTTPGETEKLLCPPGEYQAIVEKVDARRWQAKDDPSKAGVAMDVVWAIQDERATSFCKRDKVLVRQSIMFNFKEDGITIDMDKAQADIGFGRLREAVGLNDREFSPDMLPGRMALVKVSNTSDTKDGVEYRNDKVVGVARI